MTNNYEIERKWLIREVPFDIFVKLKSCEKIEITQGYISHDPHIRIRKYNEKYFLNFKKVIEKEDIVREEYETEISSMQYDNLIKKVDGIIINKTRYILPIENNLIMEVDFFHDIYDGLIYAEIEFPTKNDAIMYKTPIWFFKELTGRKEFTNAGLSVMKKDVNSIYKNV